MCLLEGDLPEQRLTGLAALRDAGGRGIALPASSKDAFLRCIEATDLRVRRAALMTLGAIYASALGTAWDLPADGHVLAAHLLKAVEVRQELITQVDMGPFKHKIDTGLRLRKTAFVALAQLARAAAAAAAVEAKPAEVPLATLIKAVALGIVDPKDEVQPLASELLGVLAECMRCWEPEEVDEELPKLSTPVEEALTRLSVLSFSEQSSKDPQTAERAREVLRCLCRSLQQLREKLQSEGFFIVALEETLEKAVANAPGLDQYWAVVIS